MDVKSKRCGMFWSKNDEFCRHHAMKEMVDVRNTRCGHPGCSTQATFGRIGSKIAQFCSSHAAQGMINVKSKRCGAHRGCNTQPKFGVVGCKPEFCAVHAKRGMEKPLPQDKGGAEYDTRSEVARRESVQHMDEMFSA